MAINGQKLPEITPKSQSAIDYFCGIKTLAMNGSIQLKMIWQKITSAASGVASIPRA